MGEYLLPKVKAKFKYTRTNEDELQFEKGAIIQLVTKDEGGWYEGKYNGQIGWFPSNYVKEIKKKNNEIDETKKNSDNLSETDNKSIQFRQQVMDDFILTESAHVDGIQNMLKSYLTPLDKKSVLSSSSFKNLVGVLKDILSSHISLLEGVKASSKLPEPQQKVGKLFLDTYKTFETLFIKYCNDHHRAIKDLLDNKIVVNKCLETNNTQSTTQVSLNVITQGLSKPFRRLEYYPTALKEIERQTSDANIDKINLLKAKLEVEKLAFVCQELRKRKESEYHVLTTPISGWDLKDSINSLGDVLYSSPVVCLVDNIKKISRYFLLFSKMLLMLSTSARMSTFKFESKILISNLQIKKLDDCSLYQHAFQVKGNNTLIVVTQSAEEQRLWIESYEKAKGLCSTKTASPTLTKCLQGPSIATRKTPIVQIPQPSSSPSTSVCCSNQRQSQMSPPNIGNSRNFTPAIPDQSIKKIECVPVTVNVPKEKIWSGWSLRPSKLSKIRFAQQVNGKDGGTLERSRSPKGLSKKKRKNLKSKFEKADNNYENSFVHNDKQMIDAVDFVEEKRKLDLIESYLNSSKSENNTKIFPTRDGKTKKVHSILEEKIIAEDPKNSNLIVEKSVIDTIYEMKDKINKLELNQESMQKRLKHFEEFEKGVRSGRNDSTSSRPVSTLKKSSSLSRKFAHY